MVDLDAIFKAYDVRGLVPEELDEEGARRIGAAFARFAGAGEIAVGRDCRLSSRGLASALIAGVVSQGVTVRDLGLVTTDMAYFASGKLDIPGAMVTASHNPKGYNGIKFCLAGAAPVGQDTGLGEIKAWAARGLDPAVTPEGAVVATDILDRYTEHVTTLVKPEALRPLRVAVDGGNGVAGVAIPSVFARLPAELVGLYLEPDGNFPNHHPDPLRPENLRDLEVLMSRERPDFGVAFDGDADRALVIDDEIRAMPGSTVTAMIARWFLDRAPGASIVHNLICSKAVPEIVTAAGGVPVRTRVGHSFIKDVMRRSGAVFGGEHSGHYYFRDNYGADSGILAVLVLMQILSEDGRSLSEIRREYEPYAQSGEINFRVADTASVIDAVGSAFRNVHADCLDGLTVDLGAEWFNLRPSNTEPVLRLNVEALDAAGVDTLVDRVRMVIEEEA